jgi:hypothetical protein
MRLNLCQLLPDLAQHIILEFLDYKLRCGKYIKQLPKNLPIYKDILNRPEVKIEYYCWDDWYNSKYVYKYEDDDEDDIDYYIGDEDGNKTYFIISIIIEFIKRKNWIEKTLEIKYAHNDRNTFSVNTILYDYDYDGTKHIIVD